MNTFNNKQSFPLLFHSKQVLLGTFTVVTAPFYYTATHAAKLPASSSEWIPCRGRSAPASFRRRLAPEPVVYHVNNSINAIAFKLSELWKSQVRGLSAQTEAQFAMKGISLIKYYYVVQALNESSIPDLLTPGPRTHTRS